MLVHCPERQQNVGVWVAIALVVDGKVDVYKRQGYCGALMFGESGTSRTGEVHRYYKCATAKKHKDCKKKTVRKQWLEDLVVNQTMQLVKDDAAMESIIARVMELQNKENTNIPLYEKQLRDAESGIQNMLNAIQALSLIHIWYVDGEQPV